MTASIKIIIVPVMLRSDNYCRSVISKLIQYQFNTVFELGLCTLIGIYLRSSKLGDFIRNF